MADDQPETDTLKEIRNIFLGTWKLDASENFEEFLREMGAPFIIRKMAPLAKPELEVTIVDGKVKFCTKTTFMTNEDIVDMEEEYQNKILSSEMKIRAKFEDGKIKQSFTPLEASKKPMEGTKEVIDGKLVLTMKVGDLVMKRTFARAA